MASSFITDHPQRAPSPRLRAVLERLDGLVDWERRERAGRMRVSVEPSRDLLEQLGRPQERFLPIHVAGTKGKGSVAALIAHGLERAGLRTGTYASPHVESINERVRWGAEEIADDDLAQALEASLEALERARSVSGPGAEATWFDVLTAAAFQAFAKRGVEVGVIECGLGGRLDSTNVVQAPLCVITSIELEHTAILGETRTAIALEKAGIIGPEASVILGLASDDPAGHVIAEYARSQGAAIHSVSAGPGPPDGEPSLPGTSRIARINRALAVATLDEFARRFAERFPAARMDPTRAEDQSFGAWALDEATCRAASLPGRLERRRVEETSVYLDGAHTLDSLRAALEAISADPLASARLVCVFGVGGEKNAAGLLKTLGQRADSVVCTSVGPGPYRAPEELRSIAHELGIDAIAIETPQAALAEALRLAGSDRSVLVTGSLHLVGAVRRFTLADPPNG